MSDLIRRKDVTEFMFNNRMCTSINNAYDQLKCIPTAYDPDKIVEQLEELRKECEDPLQDYDPNYFIEKAIEFVKGGGVDG